jgi:hypothetical protein
MKSLENAFTPFDRKRLDCLSADASAVSITIIRITVNLSSPLVRLQI